MTLADRVVVMNGGNIEQVGSPQELYHAPSTKFVAGFIGSPAMNLIPCTLEENAGELRVKLTEQLRFPIPDDRRARYRSHLGRGKLLFGLRPEHILERRPSLEAHQHPFDFVLDVTEPMGMETLIYFSINGSEVCGRVSPNAGAQAGKTLTLVADLGNMHLVDDQSGKVL
jgi:multiple sugar transport system ATP-binding protein